MRTPPRRLTCLFVGESALLRRCAEIVAGRGHTVVALVTPDEGIPAGVRVYRSMGEAMAGLADRPDVLFSIVNRTILQPDEIGFACQAAINYHDSPLPAYAGVNAPSWAILNGESSHGITWHLMHGDVDAGDIVVQRRFPITDADTALSLAATCYEHAVDAFGEVLDRLEAGLVRGDPQDLARRTVFPRSRRLPRQGIIRWADAAAHVCRFARAGQTGPYANDFGLPKVLLPDGLLASFSRIGVVPPAGVHPAGTVVGVEPQTLTVVAGDGAAVRVSGLTTLTGRAFDPPASWLGRQLPALTPAEETAIEAAQVAAARCEDATRARFVTLPAPLRPRGVQPFRSGDAGDHVFERPIEPGRSAGSALATVLDILLRDAGPRPRLVGLHQRHLTGFMRMRPFVCDAGGPESLAAALDRELHEPRVPADLPARFPELRGAWARIESMAVCLSADSAPEVDNPGLLVCHGDGRLTLRFAASQIDAERAAEIASILFGETVGPPPCHPADGSLVQRWISARAAAAPDSVAIESGPDALTYGELEARSDRLAARLRAHGAGPEHAYAVLLPQGLAFPVTVVAVLKSGAAYVPLDTSAPLHRLRDIVRDARPLGIITDEAHGQLARQLTGDVFLHSATAPEAAPERVTTEPHDLAYMIYTSGSTGEPKASMIEHAALAHLVATVIARHAIGPGDRVLQLCPVGFDASVEEIFSALCAGATLVIRSATLLDSAAAFLDFCEAARLTIIGIYAPMLGDIVAAMEQRGRFPATVRLATTGGESVTAVDARRWRDFFQSRGLRPPRLLNVYGLTETTVANLMADLSQPGDVAIGHPLPGNLARVVDASGVDVAVGDVGELLLAGPQLARAYWNRPALTATRFFTEPRRGARWFRTGDLARVGPDGGLQFVGRVDRQVKVNGVRIELEDIERAMLSCPGVRQAAACVCDLPDGRTLLAGFFSPALAGLAESLQRHLEQRLPASMRPRRLLGIDAFPVNDRGKTDHAALAASLERLPAAGLPPAVGDALPRIWKDFFPWSAGDDARESFFDLGGDSLSALRLLLRVEEETGVLLPASAFFQEPSLAGLRRLIRESAAENAPRDQLVALQAQGTRQPIYVIHGVSGDVAAYAEIVKSFGAERPVIGVRSRAVWDRTQLPPDVDHAVADIAAAIRRHRPEGPWILVGFSWAGVLAYETAARLARDSTPPLVIMIETLAPWTSFSTVDRIRHVLMTVPAWTLHWGLRGWARVVRRGWNRLRASPSPTPPRDLSPQAPPSIERHFLTLAERHLVTAEPRLTIHLLRATVTWPPTTPLDDRQKLWDDYCWRRASGATVLVHRIPGRGRVALLRQPHCRNVAALIASLCRSAERDCGTWVSPSGDTDGAARAGWPDDGTPA